jgi:peptidoglycan/xylan/chitin deacetylase (PgdA/CDA1 family)
VTRWHDIPGPTRDYQGYGRAVPKVEWPNGAKIAVSLIVNWEEGSEPSFSAGDGRNVDAGEVTPLGSDYRDLGVESIWEYGSRSGVWRLQRLFEEYDIPVTFFACAAAFEENPEVAAWVREAGHEPAGHGYRWERMWLLSDEEERHSVEASVESIQRTVGERPYGWYSRYSASVRTRELLVENGFLYDCDSYADDLPYFTPVKDKQHLVLPYTLVYNDGRFLTPQGVTDPSAFLDHCVRGFDYMWREGETHPRMMSIGLHPRIIGHAARASALREFIEHALGRGDVWFARRIDIARWWLEHHERFER